MKYLEIVNNLLLFQSLYFNYLTKNCNTIDVNNF